MASLNPSVDVAPDTRYRATLTTGIRYAAGATNPDHNLAANTQYTAGLTSNTTDAATNPLTVTTWSFTTGP